RLLQQLVDRNRLPRPLREERLRRGHQLQPCPGPFLPADFRAPLEIDIRHWPELLATHILDSVKMTNWSGKQVGQGAGTSLTARLRLKKLRGSKGASTQTTQTPRLSEFRAIYLISV